MSTWYCVTIEVKLPYKCAKLRVAPVLDQWLQSADADHIGYVYSRSVVFSGDLQAKKWPAEVHDDLEKALPGLQIKTCWWFDERSPDEEFSTDGWDSDDVQGSN